MPAIKEAAKNCKGSISVKSDKPKIQNIWKKLKLKFTEIK